MLIEEEFAPVFRHGKVKRKVNRTPPKLSIKKGRPGKAKAARVVSRSPEVMIKITKFGKGAQKVGAHFDYISRNGKVELETDQGEILSERAAVREYFNDWAAEFDADRQYKQRRDTMQMVLSMPAGTDPAAVKSATRDFAKKTFGINHEYIFALHTDEPHPHCHLTVKCLSHNGQRLNPRKEDLQTWRESFAEEMRARGWDAEATPRQVRGVVKKSKKAVIKHIEKGDKTHQPRVSKIMAQRVKEAVAEIKAEREGKTTKSMVINAALTARQEKIKQDWLKAAQDISDSDQALAGQIKAFVAAMPKVETAHDHLKSELAQRFQHKEKNNIQEKEAER